MLEGYMTVKETAAKWEISTRRIQVMCNRGMIEGAAKFGKAWAIPKDAEKPVDGRVTTGEYVNWRKKQEKS